MSRKNKAAQAEYNKQYRADHRDAILAWNHAYWVRIRLEALNHYSHGELKCACCGEREYKFLCLDHIDGGGTQHRKSLGSKYILSYLKQAGWPEGYQVLCHNCNMAKGFYGVCPHKEKSAFEVTDESQNS